MKFPALRAALAVWLTAAPISVYAQSGYASLSLTDFVLDHNKLFGQRVALRGRVSFYTSTEFFLTNFDPSTRSAVPITILVDVSNIERDLRKTVFEKCGLAGCPMTVSGTVASGLAIIADSLQPN